MTQREEKQNSMPPSLAEKGRGGFRLPTLYNPFAIRVLQIFTGFGVGCGVGIGVGRPINLSKILLAPVSLFI